MNRPLAIGTQQLENERVIVTEWRFAPGAETGAHRHGYDYVITPITNGTMLLQTPEGEKIAELVAGQSYFRQAGVEHNVINAGDSELVFVETELK